MIVQAVWIRNTPRPQGMPGLDLGSRPKPPGKIWTQASIFLIQTYWDRPIKQVCITCHGSCVIEITCDGWPTDNYVPNENWTSQPIHITAFLGLGFRASSAHRPERKAKSYCLFVKFCVGPVLDFQDVKGSKLQILGQKKGQVLATSPKKAQMHPQLRPGWQWDNNKSRGALVIRNCGKPRCTQSHCIFCPFKKVFCNMVNFTVM